MSKNKGWKFISPIEVWYSLKKKFRLNLNMYRNTHYRILNTCKIHYKDMMVPQIEKAPRFEKIICLYKVFPKSKRHFDVGNVCSIHEKFFEDALVELGKLPDDNTTYIPVVVYVVGEVDKENPRVEIYIQDFNKEGVDKLLEIVYDKL